MTPALSPAAWKAAQIAAERAFPVLLAKGFREAAFLLSHRAKQFAEHLSPSSSIHVGKG